MPALTGGRIAP